MKTIKNKISLIISKFRKLLNFEKRILRIYPTLRCNLKCNYCVNTYNPDNCKNHNYKEISSQEWLNIIKKSRCKTVVLTGGEPTLYKEFYKLINSIPEKIEIKIYSNMTFDANSLISKIKRPITFLGSYHSSCKSITNILNCITIISKHNISGTLHIIDTPENKNVIKESKEIFGNKIPSNWSFSIDADQRELYPSAKGNCQRKVICSRDIIIVAPDGIRYPCIAGLTSQRWALEDLKKEKFSPDRFSITCDNWGSCAPCDGIGKNKIKFLD